MRIYPGEKEKTEQKASIILPLRQKHCWNLDVCPSLGSYTPVNRFWTKMESLHFLPLPFSSSPSFFSSYFVLLFHAHQSVILFLCSLYSFSFWNHLCILTYDRILELHATFLYVFWGEDFVLLIFINKMFNVLQDTFAIY